MDAVASTPGLNQHVLEWNLLIRTPLGPAILSFVERLSSFRDREEYFRLVLSGLAAYTIVMIIQTYTNHLSQNIQMVSTYVVDVYVHCMGMVDLVKISSYTLSYSTSF